MNAPVTSAARGQWWWFGELATLKLGAAETAGALSILEILAPAGLTVPIHVHYREDETFVILEGSAEFVVGGKKIAARAGDVLFGQRGVPHGYRVGPDGCRMLFQFTPGLNMESFVKASSVPAAQPTLPPSEVMPPEHEALLPLLEEHGLAFV